MYACMHACMYVCMYVCMYIYICLYIDYLLTECEVCKVTSWLLASIPLAFSLKLSLRTFNFFFCNLFLYIFCKRYLNLVCFSSNQLGNFPVKTSWPVRKTYCTARQPISVRHFAYRPDSELSHIINICL